MTPEAETIVAAEFFVPVDREGLFPVTVQRIHEAADGIRAIELAASGPEALPAWQPGAHVDVYVNDQITRQYSLCGSPDSDRLWRIGVLREPKSRGGSEAMHGTLREGDTLWVSAPKNNFRFGPADRYLFIAGGIGITPLIPMIRECHEAGADWRLVYGGRSLSSMAFRDELASYGDRVTFWPQDENGHIDLSSLLDAPPAGTHVYCCGPSRCSTRSSRSSRRSTRSPPAACTSSASRRRRRRPGL